MTWVNSLVWFGAGLLFGVAFGLFAYARGYRAGCAYATGKLNEYHQHTMASIETLREFARSGRTE